MNLKPSKFSGGAVLFGSLILLLLPIVLIELNAMHHNGGTFMYPLDDTFIHMSIAKNLALYGNWGITRFDFASASSSLFYTGLIALLFKLFSLHIIIPFIVNLIAAVTLLIILKRWLDQNRVSMPGQLGILTIIIFLTPLPILVIGGMEHTLQCIFSFLFIFRFAAWLEKMQLAPEKKWALPRDILLYGLLVCGMRYEGVFLIGIACLLLLWFKKIKPAFLLGFVSVLPIVLFGIYAMSKGSYFFPNSVLLKSDSVPLSFSGMLHFISNILVDRLTLDKSSGITLVATQRLVIILPLTYFVFYNQIRQKAAYKYILIILMSTTVLHLALAATGWFYRYEAYLVLCSAMVISMLCYQYWKETLAEKFKKSPAVFLLVLFGLGFPLLLRTGAAFTKASQACTNIYEQQYQMAQFLHRFYNTQTIGANDIGAVTYYTDARDLDLWGLGNIEVARSKKNHRDTPAFLDSLSRSRNSGIAVIYDSWFDPGLLARWKKVATWKIPNNVICGSDTVSFYAVDPAYEATLKKNLALYQPSLPRDVTVSYY